MQNKKFGKLAVLSLLAAFGLTACGDTIKATPSDYNAPIVEVEGYSDSIYNDIMSIIYDQFHDSGSFGKEILNEILFEYATSVVGKYNKAINDKRSSADDNEITLKEARKDLEANAGNQKVDEFIAKHKAYWSINPNTNERYKQGEEGYEDAKLQEYSRVIEKWNTIEERIAEKLYDAFKSDGFADRHLYSEHEFVRNLKKSMNKVEDPSNVPEGHNIEITPDVEPKEVFDYYLNRDYYQSNSGLTDDESNAENTYVEDVVIPEIYRTLLVEQYLLDKSYNTLGGSYARKVNIISIKDNTNYPKASKSLIEYAVNKLNEAPTGTELPVDTDDNNFGEKGLDFMKQINRVYVGADLDADDTAIIESLLKDGGFTKKTIDGTSPETYYAGTSYGDLMDNFQKIKVDPNLNDESIESDFTGNGAYTVEIGKEIKKRETKQNNFVKSGWYIKNGGLTELPDAIRTRLFSVGVSNALDMANPEEYDRYQYDSGWTYDKGNDYNSYVARINSSYFLKNDKVLSEDNVDGWKDILFYDSGSATYYIVQIVEAVTTSKLSKNSTKNYSKVRSAEKMEEIVNNVLKVVGKGESYSTTATKYWLEQAGVSYHDQTVYDYFKENYPDLFD